MTVRVFTHTNVDLDAACAVWALKMFHLPARKARVIFVPVQWTGDEMTPEDIAVDISASGRGIRGYQDGQGKTRSSFAQVVEMYASPDDQQALRHVVNYVDAHDLYGSGLYPYAAHMPKELKDMLSFTSLNAVFRAIQATSSGNDSVVIGRMHELLYGMLKAGRGRQRALVEAESDKVEFLQDDNGNDVVAILRDSREFGTTHILFEKYGVRAVVYVDGNNMGVVRHPDEEIRMDDPSLKALVAAVGETREWYAHSSGFIFSHGSRKAPAASPSKVDVEEFAEAVADLFDKPKEENNPRNISGVEESLFDKAC